MSSNNQPLSGNGLTPLLRSSLNSLITSIILDSDIADSSFLVRTNNNSALYIDKYSNVGINTTSPGTQFEVASANGACMRLRYGTSSAYSNIFMNSSGYLSLNPSGGEVNTNGNLNLTAHDGSTTGLKLGGTLVAATATQLNYIAVTTAGTAAASKAIVLDSSRNITNINAITASQLTGTLQTAAQTNITSIGTLSSLTAGDITVTGILTINGGNISAGLGYVTGITPGTASPSLALVLDSSSNITGISNLGATTVTIGGVTIGATQSAYLTSITAGTASASKAIVLDSSRNITNINALTASQLTGTLQTAAQTNITSVGTLSSLTISGATILSSVTNATSSSSGGALTISGGLAVALNSFVGGNLTVGGNFTVNGTTTTVNAATVSIKDNILLLNASPAGSYDGGIIMQRYQIANNGALGDVVSDTAKETTTVVSATTNTIVLSVGNASDSYYNGWWVKVNSDVRYITGYVASTKTITVATTFSSTPTGSTSVSLYNRANAAFTWNESNKQFAATYTANDSSTTLTTLDYANMKVANLYTLGSINVSDSTESSSTSVGSIVTAGGVGIAKALYVGNGIYGTLQTAAQTNITSIGTLSNLTVNASAGALFNTSDNGTSNIVFPLSVQHLTSGTPAIGIGVGIKFNSLSLGGLTIAYGRIDAVAEGVTIFAHVGKLDFHTVYAGAFVKAMTLNSQSASASTLTLNGTGTLSCSIVSTVTAALSGTTATTSSSTGVLTIAGGIGISNTTDASSSTNGGTITTAGGVAIAKALYVGGSINGTIGTAAQTNITSVGTLTSLVISGNTNLSGHNGTTVGLQLGGTLVTAIATEINTLAGVTAGTASASKALVLNGSSNISGINSVGTTVLVLGGNSLGATESSYLTSITAGTASASKALVLNSSSNITGINSLSTTTLIVNGSDISGAISASGYVSGITPGTASATKALVLDSSLNISGTNAMAFGSATLNTSYNITGDNIILGAVNKSYATVDRFRALTLSAITLNNSNTSASGTDSNHQAYMSIGAPTITATNASVTTTNASTLYIGSAPVASTNMTITNAYALYVASGTAYLAGNLSMAGTIFTGTQAGYLTSITAGTASASKALVLNSSSNISGINSVGTTILVLGGNSLGATESSYLTSITAGTASASKALVLNSSSNISGINSLSTTTLIVNGTNVSAAIAASVYLDPITPGTASASKALVLDSSSNITGINSLGTTTLVLGSNNLGATESGYLTFITAGTASATKAMVLNSSANIAGINSLGTTTLILGGNSLGATQSGYLTSITAGTASASKALVFDSSINIASINALAFGSIAINTSYNIAGDNAIWGSANKSYASADRFRALTLNTITLNNSSTTASGTDSTHQSYMFIGTPTVTATNASVTTTNISSFYIANAPVASTNMTITNAYALYIASGTAFFGGNVSMNGTIFTSTQAGYLTSISTGTATASKALVLNSSSNISGINSLGTTILVLGGNSLGATESSYLTSITAGTASAGKALVANGSTAISGISSLGTTTLVLGGNSLGATESAYLTVINAGTASASKALVLDANSNITGINSVSTTTLILGGNSLGATQSGYLTFITAGTAAASKALVLNSSSNISGINSLGTTTLVLGGNSLGATESAYLTSITAGTASANKALIIDGSSNIAGINLLSTTTLVLGGVSLSATESGYLSSITTGTASASKALVLNSSLNISGINAMAFGSLTLNTSYNITSNNIILGSTSKSYTTADTFRSITAVNTTLNNSFTTSTATDSTHHSYVYVGTPTITATSTFVTTTNMSTVYIASAPAASTNMTITNAYALYVASGTAFFGNNVSMNGTIFSSAQAGYLTSIGLGTASANKALVFDSSINIAGINSLGTALLIAGTSFTLGGTALSASAWGAAGIQSKHLATNYTDSSTSASGTAALATFNSFAQPTLLATNATVTTTNAATVYIANAPVASTNQTITNAYALYVAAGSSFFAGNVSMNGTIFSSTQAGYLTSITPGTASASKVLVLDSSSNITGINSLSTTTLIVNGSDVSGAIAASGYLTSITPGTASASKALVLDSSSNIAGINSLSTALLVAGTSFTLGGTALSASAWGAAGIQSKRLASSYTDSSTAVSGTAALATFNSFAQPTLLATNATVTTTNAATVYIANAPVASTNQTITNAYALYVAAGSSFFAGNVSMNGTIFSSTQAGYLTSITPGTAAASKALVLDSSKTISGITNMAFGTTTLNSLYSITADSILTGAIASKSYTASSNNSFRALTILASTLNDTTTAASGTNSNFLSYSFIGQPTLTATNTAVITTAVATLNVSGPPIASTNMTITNLYSLYVASGNSAFNGFVSINMTSVPSYGLDFGLFAAPPAMGINLYAGTRGFGASTNALDYYSDASHKWFFGNTAQAGGLSTAPSGTNTMELTSGGILIVTGTTNSTSATTGIIKTNGGVGIAKDLFIGSASTASKLTIKTNDTTNAGTIIATGGTSSAVSVQLQFAATTAYCGTQSNHDFVILSNNTSRLTIAAGGDITVASTTDATSSTAGALMCAGGGAFAKKVYVGTSVTTGTSVAVGTSISVGTNITYGQWISPLTQFTGTSYSNTALGISLYDNPIYFRSQNGSDTNHGLMYSGSGNTNWNSGKGFGNPATAIDGPVLYGNGGVTIGNLNTAATETICATFVGTTTTLMGNLSMNGTIFSSTQAAYLTSITAGTASASKALVLDGSTNIAGINSVGTTTLVLGGNSLGATQSGYLTSITAGTASASKALVLDSSTNIAGINSVGTTTLVLGGNSLGATQSGYLTSITAGTASASKALVLDSSTNIAGINSLSTTLLVSGTSFTLGGTAGSASAWGVAGIQSNYVATSYTDNSTSASGTATIATFNSFAQPTLLATNATVTTTNAATVYIANAPVASTNQTITNAYALYVAAGSSFFAGSVSMNGTIFSSTQAAYLTSITAGTASASKALVLDGSTNITGINSVGTTTLVLGGNSLGATESAYLTSITAGTASASKALVLDGSTNITGINSVGTTTLVLGGNSLGATQSGYLTSITAGTASASKALVLDSSVNIAGINSLSTALLIAGTSFTLGGTALSATAWGVDGIQSKHIASSYTDSSTSASGTAALATFNSFAQPTLLATNATVTTTNAATVYIANAPVASTNQTITNAYALYVAAGSSFFAGNVSMNGTIFSSTQAAYLTSITAGTASASKALVLDSSSNITGINSVGTTTLVLGGNSLGATQSGYLTSITAGTASASKALVLDGSTNITGINSVGTTTLVLGGNSLGATQSGYLTGITAGTAAIGKALVLDGSAKTISGITNMAFGTNTIVGSYSITGDSIVVGNSNRSHNAVNAAFRAFTASTVTLTDTATAVSGTNATFMSYTFVGTPTMAATNATVTTTNAATFYINGSPAAGTNMTITNAYSFYVAGGTSFFAGNVSMNGTIFSSTQAAYLTSITAGTAAASKALVLDGSTNITGINSVGTTTLVLGGNSLGATQSGYLTSITAGVAAASKVLVLDTFKAINGITNMGFGSTTIVGTYSITADSILTGAIAAKSYQGNSNATFRALTINNSTLNDTLTAASSTNSNFLSYAYVGQSTITATNTAVVTTNIVSLHIPGPPIASTNMTITNAYSLYVGSGNSIFNGFVGIGITASPTYGLDFGTIGQPPAMAINLYGGTRGFGASSVALDYYSDADHKWYATTGAQSGANNTSPNGGSGGNTMTLTSGGNLSVSGTMTINSATDATSSTAGGAFTCAGGGAIAKKLYVGTSLTVSTNIAYGQWVGPSTQFTGTSYSNTALGISLYDNPIYFRGQNGSDKNHGIMYSGTGNSNWNSSKGFGNPLTATDGPVLYGNAGVTIGNLNLSATETVCATFIGTSTTLMGTAAILSSTDATSSTAGGALTCAGGAGIAKKLYVGTDTLTTRNTYSTGAGVHAYGFDSTGLNSFGGGAHMHFGIGTAEFFGYNYSTSAYTASSFGHTIFVTSTNLVGIGNPATTSSYPLHIFTSVTASQSYTYQRFTISGASGTATNTQTSVSLFTNGNILCNGEVDVISDRRSKKNIHSIDAEYSIDFIKNTNPVHYTYIDDEYDNLHFGYIAQDLLKAGHGPGLVTTVDNPEFKQSIDEETGIENPEGIQFVVAYDKIIPIIAKALQSAIETIDTHETTIANQSQQINDLETRLARLEALLQQ